MNNLYYICSVLALCALNAYAQDKVCEWPKCYDNDLTIFNAYGMNLTCPPAEKCNKYKIKNVENGNCDMCLTSICKERFDCVAGSTEVTINGKSHNCPKDHECNSLEIKNCVPCVKIQCQDYVKNLWTCDPRNPRTVTIGNTAPQRCILGSICNTDYVRPCTPCITEDKKSAAIIRSLVRLVENNDN